MQEKRYRWIFFDIDDTLWDFAANSYASLQQLYAGSGLLRQRYTTFEAFFTDYHCTNARMWDLYARGEVDAPTLRVERFRQFLFPESHLDEDVAVCRELDTTYLDTLCRQTQLVDGAEEVLEYLSGKYIIGAATNGFLDTQYRKLTNTCLWKYVARMIISEETGSQKPSATYFDYCMDETGLRPSEVLMVGDNPVNDVAGALDYGMDAIFLDRWGLERPELDGYRDGTKGKGKLVAEISDLGRLIEIL